MKPYKSLTILSVSLTILLSYNFMSAAWSNPTATAPASNTDAPINVGSTAQTKAGTLSLYGLLVEGAATIASPAPRIKFDDTDAGAIDFWTYLDSGTWSLRADRNGDGAADTPHPVRVYTAATATGDYVAFSNQVRAAEYCDENGENCTDINPGSTSGQKVQAGTIAGKKETSGAGDGEYGNTEEKWAVRVVYEESFSSTPVVVINSSDVDCQYIINSSSPTNFQASIRASDTGGSCTTQTLTWIAVGI